MDLENSCSSSSLGSLEDLSILEEEDVLLKRYTNPAQQRYIKNCRKLDILPIPNIITSLVTREVALRYEILRCDGATAIVAALRNNNTVESLNLVSTSIGYNGIFSVARMLLDNDYLSELRLVGNEIGDKEISLLVDSLVKNMTIKILDLSDNRLEESSGNCVYNLLHENDTIEELYLSHNNFREKAMIEIAYGIASNRSLRLLDLSWNHIRRDGAIAICEALGSNKYLEHVILGWNGIALQGCIALVTGLAKNTTLMELDLTCNRIDGKALEHLIKAARKNSTLKTLRIAKNPIVLEDLKNLLNSLDEIKSSGIEVLDVSGITITPETVGLANRINEKRRFGLKCDVIHDHEQGADFHDSRFIHADPMIVFMEFLRLKSLRMVDLFLRFDSDKNRFLSEKEFSIGLQSAGVPLSPGSIHALFKKLDADKDGQVNFNEMFTSQRDYSRRMVQRARHDKDLPYEETEVGRIAIQLQSFITQKENQLLDNAILKAKENRVSSDRSPKTSTLDLSDTVSPSPRRKTTLSASKKRRSGSARSNATSLDSFREKEVSCPVLVVINPSPDNDTSNAFNSAEE